MIAAAEYILTQQEKLRRDNGKMICHTAFLKDVAQWMRKNGYEVCTATAAWQLWRVVNALTEHASEKHQHDADIAFWYGVNPQSLTEVEKLGYLANLNRQIARQKIINGRFNGADHKQVYALYKLAYGDEEIAQRAATEAAKRLVDERTRK